MHALGRFNLTEHFGLDSLIREAELPSVAALREPLEAADVMVPRFIPLDFLARSIHNELLTFDLAQLGRGAQESVVNIGELESIPAGKHSAARYHEYMYRALPEVFDQWLVNPRKEQPESDKIKFIDITFDNVATDGFFWELVTHHRLLAAHIVIECKNYSADPRSPEFDQATGRLGHQVGQFGIIFCRRILDNERVLKYQRDALRRELRLLVLSDQDFSNLLAFRLSGESDGISNLLRQKLHALDFA